MQQVPNIHLGRYLRGDQSTRERTHMLTELAEACEDHGFFLLHGHGCEALIEAMFAQSEAFFALSRELKLRVAISPPTRSGAPAGRWTCPGLKRCSVISSLSSPDCQNR